MTEGTIQVLLVEDNAGDVRLLREMFSKEHEGSFELTHLFRMRDAELHLAKGGVDIILLDMGLPDEHGIDTVRRSIKAAPGVPVIVFTGLDDEALAAEAMREGAQDYLIKGQIENRALPRALRYAIERYHLERRLRDQQFYTRSLIESNIDALITTDPEGIITDVNQQMEALTGCTRDELTGAPFKNYFTDPDRAEEGIARVLREGKVNDYELTARGRNGGETAVSYNATTFYDQNSKLQGVFASARDITERKRFERTLQDNNIELERARAAAEKANLAKSDFLSSMSHEIRTPMNAILGLADILWESPLNAEQNHYVEVFRRAGASLLALINDILDLAKIEAGHFDLERIEFVAEEVVNQAMELTAGEARGKGIPMVCRFAPDLPTALIGDPGRLKQVLINMLGNAVKFTETGEIVLFIGNHQAGKPGDLEFVVSDTGIGISAEKLKTIFDDFTQGDVSITRKYGGTGLGLGISRRIVEAMGGSLTATSSPGKGSTFRFTAQFDRAPQKAQSAGAPFGDLCSKRVLLIDDNETNCLILRETLQTWGMKSDTYRLPKKALEHLPGQMSGEQPYSLVIIDDGMPGMDGFETAAEIGRIAGSLPVVMLTSDAKPGDAARRVEAGLAGYAVKPVTRAELLRLVGDAISMRERPELHPSVGGDGREEPFRPASILVAEDSPDNRLLVEVYLKGRPYTLTFQEDGKSAVDRFARADFDLILMDVRMPVMDGLAATRAIRALERERGTAPIPILALTANATLQDVERSRDAGCDAHLSKPISKSELLIAIEKYRRPEEPSEMTPSRALESIIVEMPRGLEDIIPGYLASRRREVSELPDLLAAYDFERLSFVGHNMKGAARGYGFAELVRMGATLEQSADRKDEITLRAQIAALGNYLARVQLVAKS